MTPSARTRIHATGEGAPIVKRVKIDKLSALIMSYADDGHNWTPEQVRNLLRQVPVGDEIPTGAIVKKDDADTSGN